MKRKCEVCGSGKAEYIDTMKFFIAGETDPYEYTVAACECGFIFANDIPSQDQYEKYYSLSSRYIYDAGNMPEGLAKIHRDSFSLIDTFLANSIPPINKETFGIIDIGCATGHLLHLFKECGYRNLLGLEPSRECCAVARSLDDVPVLPVSLSHYKTDRKFNLAILSGVLEHISDLSGSMSFVSSLLGHGGILFTLVPDAERFSSDPREPFHEFSLEHINFFTSASLTNLLGAHGFSCAVMTPIETDFYDSHAIAGIWRKTGVRGAITRDPSSVSRIREYITRSHTKMASVENKIATLVKSGEEVAVWGVGSLTSRLLAATSLRDVNITSYVDSNPSLQHMKMNGVEILSPDSLMGKSVTVLISSYVYGREIKTILEEKFRYEGKIVVI